MIWTPRGDLVWVSKISTPTACDPTPSSLWCCRKGSPTKLGIFAYGKYLLHSQPFSTCTIGAYPNEKGQPILIHPSSFLFHPFLQPEAFCMSKWARYRVRPSYLTPTSPLPPSHHPSISLTLSINCGFKCRYFVVFRFESISTKVLFT